MIEFFPSKIYALGTRKCEVGYKISEQNLNKNGAFLHDKVGFGRPVKVTFFGLFLGSFYASFLSRI